MNAYHCDGCRTYMTGGMPKFTIIPNLRLMSDPEEWHACSDDCLVLAASRIASSRDLGSTRTDA